MGGGVGEGGRNVNANVSSLASQTPLEQQVLSHTGHAYATRCVYKYRVHLIAHRASSNASNAMCLRVCRRGKVQATHHGVPLLQGTGVP